MVTVLVFLAVFVAFGAVVSIITDLGRAGAVGRMLDEGPPSQEQLP